MTLRENSDGAQEYLREQCADFVPTWQGMLFGPGARSVARQRNLFDVDDAPEPEPRPDCEGQRLFIECVPLGFASAFDMTPGDQVVFDRAVRTIVDVKHAGEHWPYFKFDGTTWVSWQLCGLPE
ncbi:MAG: hypothetical protein K2R98_16815 [Gemmataceae bacterium]|nr:hypothetical protein [Gemmataceae bacterium]